MANEWWIRSGDKAVGPFTATELKQKSTAGEITAETRVRNGRDGKWVRASRVRGLLHPAASPPPRSQRPPLVPQGQLRNGTVSDAAPPQLHAAPCQAATANGDSLSVVYPGQFFLFDVKVRISLDGEQVGTGHVKKGIHATIPTNLGEHRLEVSFMGKTTEYHVRLDKPGSWTIHLKYSKKKGGFDDLFRLVGRKAKKVNYTFSELLSQSFESQSKMKPFSILTVTVASMCWLLAYSDVIADVLVTKSGRKHAGEIVKEGDRYVVNKPDGGRVTFPASLVQQIVKSDAVNAKYGEYLAKANLADEKHVEYLLEFAGEWGLEKERADLLRQMVRRRWPAAVDDMKVLTALSEWCAEHGFAEGVDVCKTRRLAIEFQEKYTAAKSDALALAKLVDWCEEHSLKVETDRCSKEALALAPDDVAVRELLRYVRDESTGTWKKIESHWRIEVLGASIQESFTDNEVGTSSTTYRPNEGSFAVIRVAFSAVSAHPGSLEERVEPLKAHLNKIGMDLLLGEERETLAKKPSRAWINTDVRLEYKDGAKAAGITSQPEGSGVTVSNNSVSVTISGEGTDPAVLKYLRMGDVTALLIQPKRETKLTLCFPVPTETRRAKLKFCDHKPILIEF